MTRSLIHEVSRALWPALTGLHALWQLPILYWVLRQMRLTLPQMGPSVHADPLKHSHSGNWANWGPATRRVSQNSSDFFELQRDPGR